MSFNYSEYYNNALIIPLIFLIISFGFTGASVFNYIRTKNKESFIQSKNKKPLILLLISIVVCYSTISTQTTTLIYGINLTVESVEDAVEYVGEVKSIEKISLSPRYMHNGSVVRASIVDVGEKELYFMSASEIKVGDIIDVTYLPKSTMVLSYQPADNVSLNDQIVNNSQRNDGAFIYAIIFGIAIVVNFITKHINERYIKQKIQDELKWNKNEILSYKTSLLNIFRAMPILLLSMVFSLVSKDMVIILIFLAAFIAMILTYKNQKITYDEYGISVYNLFGKSTIYPWSKIVSVVEKRHSSPLSSTENKALVITFKKQNRKQAEVFRNISLECDDYIGIFRFLDFANKNL